MGESSSNNAESRSAKDVENGHTNVLHYRVEVDASRTDWIAPPAKLRIQIGIASIAGLFCLASLILAAVDRYQRFLRNWPKSCEGVVMLSALASLALVPAALLFFRGYRSQSFAYFKSGAALLMGLGLFITFSVASNLLEALKQGPSVPLGFSIAATLVSAFAAWSCWVGFSVFRWARRPGG